MSRTDSKYKKYVEALKDRDVIKKARSFKSVNGQNPTFDNVFELLEKFPWLIKAKFSGAEVEIYTRGKLPKYLVWYDGVWEKGTWEDGRWENGTWKNGTWNGGLWVDGEWKNGTWMDGNWWNGEWKNGTWIDGDWDDGIWNGGTWKKGYWDEGYDGYGDYHDKNDSPDKW